MTSVHSRFGVSMLLTVMRVVCLTISTGWADREKAPGCTMAQQATKSQASWTTADHSKHAALKKIFRSGSEITAACLSCHSEAAAQFKGTIHWTWIGYTDETGKQLGKAGDSLNSFCIAINNMTDKGCNACHTGWQGKEQGINCLNCHSRSTVKWADAFEERTSLIQDDLTAKITCESCHGATSHEKGHKANDHTDKVACQSFHIPEFAGFCPPKYPGIGQGPANARTANLTKKKARWAPSIT